jgi:hypothetical protein
MSGRERTVKPERRQPRMPQTPEEIKAVCDLFRELLREEYARQDAEDAKLLAEFKALERQAVERLAQWQRLLAEWQPTSTAHETPPLKEWRC